MAKIPVRDDRPDQFRCAVEQSLQVERRAEPRVGHAGEEGQVRGFDARVYGINVGVRVLRVDRTIVAFILRLWARDGRSRWHWGTESMIADSASF